MHGLIEIILAPEIKVLNATVVHRGWGSWQLKSSVLTLKLLFKTIEDEQGTRTHTESNFRISPPRLGQVSGSIF